MCPQKFAHNILDVGSVPLAAGWRNSSESNLIFILILLLILLTTSEKGVGQETRLVHSSPDYLSFVQTPSALTLEDCLSIGLQKNRELNQSRSRVSVAQAKKRQLVASQLPKASVQIQESLYGTAAAPTAKDQQELFRLGISATIEPFGRFKSLKRSSEAQIQVAEAERSSAEIETAFQVTRAFYDLLLSKHLEKVASDSVDQLQLHRDHTARLVETGAVPGFDLLRAEVQLSSAKPALIRASHAISTDQADLLHLLGIDPTATPQIIGSFSESIPDSIPIKEEEAVHLAFQQRPDLRAAKALLDSAAHALKATQQALQPSIQLTHLLDRSRGSQQPVDSYSDNRTTQLGLNIPVFDTGLTRAQTKEAAANLHTTRLSYESTVSQAYVEIRKSVSDLSEASEVVVSQEKNVEQAREALTIAESGYQTGAKTSLDVLDAQLALTQAKTLWYQSLRDRTVALARLEKALGFMPGYFRNSSSISTTAASHIVH